MFALKAITDFVDGAHPPQEQFLQNLDEACRQLKQKTYEVLEYLGKNLDEWQ
jgi:hypothetical protein